MASDAVNGGGWRKGWWEKKELSECHFRFRSVSVARLSMSLSPPYFTSHGFFPPYYCRSLLVFPFFLLVWVANFFFSFPPSVNSLHPTLPLHRGDCAACECYWFGRLAGVWPGLTHLLPGRFLSVPPQLTLRCVHAHMLCIWESVCVLKLYM